MTPSIEKELDDASGISIIEIAGPSLSANIITPGGKVTANLLEHQGITGIGLVF